MTSKNPKLKSFGFFIAGSGYNGHLKIAFNAVFAHKKSAIPKGMTDSMELLARFELATRFPRNP